MSNITNFSFNGSDVRVVDIAGEPHFVGKDVAERLGYANATDAMNRHCKGVVKRYPLQTAGGKQEARVISEPDVLRLIVNSQLPEAQKFERWVFEDVLPSIRKTGTYTAPQPKASQSGLPEFRRARAIDMAAKAAERISAQFPSLGEDSRRTLFANIINPVAGAEVISLPRIEQKHYSAGEVGEKLGISANMVGRIANQYDLKTVKHGQFRLDKSKHSNKQVESFAYNDAGVAAIAAHLNAPEPVTQAAQGAAL